MGAKEISEAIAQIRENLEKNVDQLEIDAQLNALQETVRKYAKKANQRYSIEEVKKSIHRIQNASRTVTSDWNSEFAFNDTLQTEEQYIQSVSSRISDFEGQERDLLIASLMEARYRIAMGKLLTNTSSQDCYDFFKSVPEVEKIMYVKFLFADYNELISRYNLQYSSQKEVQKAFEQLQLDYPEAPKLTLKSKSLLERTEQGTDKIIDEFSNDLIDDFQATGLFSKPDFLAMFAKTWLNTNSIEQSIKDDKKAIENGVQDAQRIREEQAEDERQKQQARRKQEEARLIEILKQKEQVKRQKELEEKYKNMSDAEIQDEIARIDSQTFDMKEKYRKIMDFQIIIAKARGLISEKESMELTDIAFLPYATEEIPSIIDMLNQNNIFSTAMLGVDDNRKTSVLLVSKAEKDKIADISKKFKKESARGYQNYSGVKFIGKLTANVLARLPIGYRENFVIMNPQNNQYSVYEYYIDSTKRCKKRMSELYQSIRDMNDDETIKQKIKFSIQLPIQRSILPVIEQLKQAGIEFYIPPIDIPEFDFKKSEPTYRIYIDRQYLEQYKENVHQILSEGGVVLIGNEQVNVADLMLSNCEFPYGLDKQKEL